MECWGSVRGRRARPGPDRARATVVSLGLRRSGQVSQSEYRRQHRAGTQGALRMTDRSTYPRARQSLIAEPIGELPDQRYATDIIPPVWVTGEGRAVRQRMP